MHMESRNWPDVWSQRQLPEDRRKPTSAGRRIGVGLHHLRRHGAEDRGLRDATVAVARDVVHHLAAPGRMAHVDSAFQVQVLGQCCEIVGVVVHVVTVGHLAGPAVPAANVSDHTVAVLQEEQHRSVPVVG